VNLPDIVQLALGPAGGLIGIAFGMGAAAGWGFAAKTVLKMAERERLECHRQLEAAQARVKEVEDAYRHGMERQLGQVRQSSVTLIERERK